MIVLAMFTNSTICLCFIFILCHCLIKRILLFIIIIVPQQLGGRVEDAGLAINSSNPDLSAVECNPGQVANTHVPLSPSSIIWYQPMGGEALRLGR